MARAEKTGRFTILAYGAFLCRVALTGGSSRFDAASQPLARLAAIALIAALIVHQDGRDRRACRPGLWFLAAVAGLIAVQLIPLPPAIWTLLPGREQYLAAAVAAGEHQPWRPINLTPDRGWNSLFALLPPAA